MVPRIALGDGFEISRIIKGGWHLAGGHGTIDVAGAQRDMAAFVEAGISTFDCANIYTGVEQLIGDFRSSYPEHAKRVQVFTKFVPDLADLPTVDRHYVESAIDQSLSRLGVEQLDAVQFHWWDYKVPRYVETALELDRLQRSGKIARIAVTNFDMAHLREIVAAGVRVLSHQLQYSLLDTRPELHMVEYCQGQGIALLCYGTVAGGFLSERWLGQPEPEGPLANRSLVKYKLIIDDFGGWPRFQALLGVLRQIALKHDTDIATVATRAILDRPGVAAAIVGATSTAHLEAHTRIGTLTLDADDLALLAHILQPRMGPLGDVYILERDRTGRHGRIMKYNLTHNLTHYPTEAQ
jgi:aryl-alcohol dehydrogenase-like predicted oxidoreductase